MKRAVVLTGAVVALLALWAALPDAEPVAFDPPSVDVARWEPLDLPADDEVLAEQVSWAREARALGIACDLPLRTTCEGDRCAAMTEVPMVDNPGGWAWMGVRSPKLVLSVVAGDLGLPDRISPCRGAIRDMGMRTVARAHDGGELWCLVEGDDPEGLCDRLSGQPGFVASADRIVELREPGT